MPVDNIVVHVGNFGRVSNISTGVEVRELNVDWDIGSVGTRLLSDLLEANARDGNSSIAGGWTRLWL